MPLKVQYNLNVLNVPDAITSVLYMYIVALFIVHPFKRRLKKILQLVTVLLKHCHFPFCLKRGCIYANVIIIFITKRHKSAG